MWEPSSGYSFVHFCRQLSPIEPQNRRNRDPTSATKDGHFTQKNTGFRAPEFTRSRPVTHPNYDDEVVGAMMVRRLAMTYEIELSLQSRAPFADLIFKSDPTVTVCFCDFYVKSSSCYEYGW